MLDQPVGDGDDQSSARRPQGMAAHVLGIFALCGFAVAQPIFALLGEQPTYFVVHGVEGIDLVWFALLLVLVPPLLPVGVLVTARAVSVEAERWLMTAFVGSLVAITVVPAINRGVEISDPLFIALLIVLGTSAAVSYATWSPARMFVSYLSPAPVLFTVLFLTSSPASALLDTQEGDLLPKQDLETPVVVVVFDEFALGVLLNVDGTLDTEHFPGFARLAARSTWYPNATTTAFRTDLAVPTILSSSIRPMGTPPTAAEYPRSLFSMLGASYSVRADEVVTHVCPKAVCSDSPPTEGALVKDTAIAYLHGVLPEGLGESWLPALGARWGGFADERGSAGSAAGDTPSHTAGATPTDAPVTAGTSTADSVADASGCTGVVCTPGWDDLRFERFLAAIEGPSSTPQLLYHHALLPHVPYRYLPDGTNYEPISTTWGLQPAWIDDPDFMAVMTQRYFLQSLYVDRLVGRLLDRLEATSTLDDALVVIVADHGVSLEPGSGLRGSEDGKGTTRHGVQPVPLFVKLPGQQDGAVDVRPAQIIDVLPTIADALQLELPNHWNFDGRSLLGPPAESQPRRWFDEQLSSELHPESFGARVRSSIVDLPGRSDFVGAGPYGSIIGKAVTDFKLVPGFRGSTRLDNPDAYDNVDQAGLLPALLTGTTAALKDDDWVAVAIDGIVAGVGPVYDDDGQRLVALLDPRALRSGTHHVRAYVIRDSGSSLEELSLTE